jgi:hypothetical protein
MEPNNYKVFLVMKDTSSYEEFDYGLLIPFGVDIEALFEEYKTVYPPPYDGQDKPDFSKWLEETKSFERIEVI